jgi:hypothetical protein
VCRDPELLHDLSLRVFGGMKKKTQYNTKPSVLLYPQDYWRHWQSNPVFPVMEAAVRELEKYLNTDKREINLAKQWETENPSGTGAPIAEYLQDVSCQRVPTKWMLCQLAGLTDTSRRL